MPADIERRLISQICLTGDMRTVNEAGVQAEWFTTTANQKVFAWQKDYYREHRRAPSWKRLIEEFPDYRVLRKVADPLTDCIERVRSQRKVNIYGDGMLRATAAKKRGDIDAVGDELRSMLRQVDQETHQLNEIDIGDGLGDHIQSILDRRYGPEILGMPTGFKTIDQATQGLQGGQLVTVLGLAKAGKSTLLMLIAQHLQEAGHRPYFVNFEMSVREQLDRYVALGAHVDYSSIQSGELTDAQEERLWEFERRSAEWPPFTVCTDTAYASTVSGLEAMVTKGEKPAVLLIDGIYFLRDEISKQQNDSVSLTNITRETKKMARRLEIPIVATHQALESKTRLRQRGGSHRQLNMYSGGYSSSFAQDSDVVFGLERDESKDSQRLLRIVAARSCALMGVWIGWDWKRGYFGDVRGYEDDYQQQDDYEDEDD